jgi:hypothetical protein
MNKLKEIFNQKIVEYDQQYKSSYLFPFIISIFGKNISNESEPIIVYSFSMFTLSFIVFICFINIFGYILSLYLISKYDIEIKFPKLKRIIKYYEKSSIIFIILEAIIGFTTLIFIIIINLVFCGSLV